MKELSADERVRRLSGAADRELEAAALADAERGDALYQACLGARQVGKTTLARQLARRRPGPTHFFDLESSADVACLADLTPRGAPAARRAGFVW